MGPSFHPSTGGELMDEQNKEISVTVTFKQLTFNLKPDEFAILVDDAVGKLKADVLTAFDAQTKSISVSGLPDLEAKGVTVSIGMTF
jgi:hypothetical protein